MIFRENYFGVKILQAWGKNSVNKTMVILKSKELSLCHKLWIYNPYFFGTQYRKSLIFQTYIIWSNRIHSLKYLRSTTFGSKDVVIRKSEFVAKTQFLCWYVVTIGTYKWWSRLDPEIYNTKIVTSELGTFKWDILNLILIDPISRHINPHYRPVWCMERTRLHWADSP